MEESNKISEFLDWLLEKLIQFKDNPEFKIIYLKLTNVFLSDLKSYQNLLDSEREQNLIQLREIQRQKILLNNYKQYSICITVLTILILIYGIFR